MSIHNRGPPDCAAGRCGEPLTLALWRSLGGREPGQRGTSCVRSALLRMEDHVKSSHRKVLVGAAVVLLIGVRSDGAGPACPLDVDCSGSADVATDVVYVARSMLGLLPVPPSFRALDPSIPADTVVAANVAALCPGQGCAPDAVPVGPLCMDKYEASVWQVPAGPSNTGLITKIKQGTVTLAELTAGGATQISPSSSCTAEFPATFPFTGQWTEPLYAVSIAGVHPTSCVSWFQAAQACRLAGKRLPTNAEWQDAAAGTPDPGTADDHSTTCNTNSADVAHTGSRGSCRSSWGAFDMVGSVSEWVADWGPLADGCTNWKGELGFTDGDASCMGNLYNTTSSYHIPGALFRGGWWSQGTAAGVFAVAGNGVPSFSSSSLGFRCAR